MSYDLMFRSNQEWTGTCQLFFEYFKQRKHYTVSFDHVIYENDATGVAFIFYVDPQDPEKTGLFNLNYARPHYFALEAELELTAFFSHFDLPIEDPQIKGMGLGPYSREGFLRGWNAGNLFSYGVFLNHPTITEFGRWALPTEKIEQNWRWNFGVEQLQEELSDSYFVPKILNLNWGGRLVSAVAWTDGMATALPTVDIIMVVRNALKPQGLFSRFLGSKLKHDVIGVEFKEVEKILEGYEHREINGMLTRIAAIPDHNFKIHKWVRGLRASSEKPTGIPMSSVLNEETLQLARITE